MYYVYILRTSGNTLYIGQTKNISKRLREHAAKSTKSAKYLRAFPSFALVYTEKQPTLSLALKREWELKQLSKVEKELLIQRATIIRPTKA